RRAGSRRRGERRDEQQRVAVEAGRRRAGLLRRDLVLAEGLVRQLAGDLELDRDEILSLDPPCPSGDREALHPRQPLLPAQRGAPPRPAPSRPSSACPSPSATHPAASPPAITYVRNPRIRLAAPFA